MPYIGNTTADFSINTGNITNRAVTALKLSPSSVGSNGQVLSVDGSGNLQWGNDTAGIPASGGTFTGDISFNDNISAKFGADFDLTIKSNGSSGFIQTQHSGGTLYLGTTTSDNLMNITASGITFLGETFWTNGNDIKINDSSKILVGTGNDLTIQHSNSSNISSIGHSNAAGSLQLSSPNSVGVELYAVGANTDYVLLRYGGGDRLFTTAEGIKVQWATGNAGEIHIAEGTSNGSHTVALTCPASVAASYKITLPGAVPTSNGQVLAATTAGIGSWIDVTALSGSTNNTICTVTGANAIQGEANLTYNGTDTLSIDHSATDENSYIKIAADDNRRKTLVFDSGGTTRGVIGIGDSDEAVATTLFLSANSNVAGNSPHLVILSDGKVGITTTTPTTNLNVAGGFHVSGTANQTKAQDGLLFQRNTSSGNCEIIAGRAGGNYTALEHYVAGANGVTKRYSVDYQSNHKWFAANGTTQTVCIDLSGHVGIGTASPNVGGHDKSLSISNTAVSARSAVNIEGNTANCHACVEMRNNGTLVSGVYSRGTNRLQFGTGASGTVAVEVNDKDLKIEDGNLIIGTAGHGINFHNYATSGNPSSNLLDDYEEGTWTPVLAGLTNHTVYYVSGNGSYTRIGRHVYCQVSLHNVDLNDSASGRILIKGLPFTEYKTASGAVRAVTSDFMTHKVYYPHSGDRNWYSWYISDSDHLVGQRSNDGGDWTAWDASNFTLSGVYIDLSFTYVTTT